MDDTTRLYGFLALAHLALLAGYLTGIRRPARAYAGGWRVDRLVLLCVVAQALVFFPTSSLYTGSPIPDVLAGLSSPGDAYLTTVKLRDASMPLVAYARILVGPLLSALLPLTVFYWAELPRRLRWGGAACTLGVVSTFIAMGTNKAIADTVLLTGFLLVVSAMARRIRFAWRRHWSTALLVPLALVLMLGFFAEGQRTRDGSPAAFGVFPAAGASVDASADWMDELSPQAKIGYLGISFYLTHGYYALYLALDKPFVPMFGVGNSMFLYRQAARITGDDTIERMPYPARIEADGWDAMTLWSTIYPWIASDVTFEGTLLVVFLIGRVFASSYLDTLDGGNPFAVAMFSQLVIMLFYFPANNQCLQSGESWTAFWATLGIWTYTRRRAPPSARWL